MTLIMAVYHHNIYPIATDDLSSVRYLLKDYFSDKDPKFPYRFGDAFSPMELRLMLQALPDNVTYMVGSFLDGYNSMFTVWLLPNVFATSAIEFIIHCGLVAVDYCKRDVRYYDFKDAIDDLPYNYHYIVQRYYA